MLRCIAVVYARLHEISGYVIRDDATKQFKMLSTQQTITLSNQKGIVNLEYLDSKLRCKDCAFDKLPRYTEGGFCLDEKPIYQVIARSSSGDVYTLLLDLTKEVSLTRRELVQLIRSEASEVCNAYVTTDGSLAVNCKESIMPIESSTPNAEKAESNDDFIIPDGKITFNRFQSDVRFRRGLIIMYFMQRGFLPKSVLISKTDTLDRGEYVIEKYSVSLIDSHDACIAEYAVEINIDEEDPCFLIRGLKRVNNSAFNFLTLDGAFSNTDYISLSFDNLDYDLLLAPFDNAEMNDSNIPEHLSCFVNKINQAAVGIAPLAISNLPSVSGIKKLYNSINKAYSSRDWANYIRYVRDAWCHRIIINSIQLHIELELSLCQPWVRDEYDLVFNRFNLQNNRDMWHKLDMCFYGISWDTLPTLYDLTSSLD